MARRIRRTKRKNTKRLNSKRKNTKRKNTKRLNSKRRNTNHRKYRGGSLDEIEHIVLNAQDINYNKLLKATMLYSWHFDGILNLLLRYNDINRIIKELIFKYFNIDLGIYGNKYDIYGNRDHILDFGEKYLLYTKGFNSFTEYNSHIDKKCNEILNSFNLFNDGYSLNIQLSIVPRFITDKLKYSILLYKYFNILFKKYLVIMLNLANEMLEIFKRFNFKTDKTITVYRGLYLRDELDLNLKGITSTTLDINVAENIIIHNSEIDQYITKEKYEEIIKNFVILEIELPVNTEFVYTDICGLGENELLLIKEGILEKKNEYYYHDSIMFEILDRNTHNVIDNNKSWNRQIKVYKMSLNTTDYPTFNIDSYTSDDVLDPIINNILYDILKDYLNVYNITSPVIIKGETIDIVKILMDNGIHTVEALDNLTIADYDRIGLPGSINIKLKMHNRDKREYYRLYEYIETNGMKYANYPRFKDDIDLIFESKEFNNYYKEHNFNSIPAFINYIKLNGKGRVIFIVKIYHLLKTSGISEDGISEYIQLITKKIDSGVIIEDIETFKIKFLNGEYNDIFYDDDINLINNKLHPVKQVPAPAPAPAPAHAPNIQQGYNVQNTPQAMPGYQLVSVMCPVGVGPGTTLQIQLPGGFMYHVVVPAGVGPGQTFQVQVPTNPSPQQIPLEQRLTPHQMKLIEASDSLDRLMGKSLVGTSARRMSKFGLMDKNGKSKLVKSGTNLTIKDPIDSVDIKTPYGSKKAIHVSIPDIGDGYVYVNNIPDIHKIPEINTTLNNLQGWKMRGGKTKRPKSKRRKSKRPKSKRT